MSWPSSCSTRSHRESRRGSRSRDEGLARRRRVLSPPPRHASTRRPAAGRRRRARSPSSIDLAFPFSLTEQDAFLAERIPAVTITTEGSRADLDTRPGRLDPVVLGRTGRAAEGLLASLDASLEPARGTGAYVYVGGRVIQGWAIALLYIALLVPFLLCLADLVARLRRWHVPLRPAVRSYLRRLGFWLFAGVVFALFGMAGAWPGGDEAAINPASEAASHWPRLALALFLLVVLAGWLVARARLVPERPVAPEDEVAGMAVALCALAVVTLVLIVTNPFGLLFVLPSAHAWLWLVQARNRGPLLRTCLYVIGLAGPMLVIGSTALRFGLGLDAPWYLAELTALGYVSLFTLLLVLAWTAVAAQVLAVVTGRYAPYPAPADRPARGAVGTRHRRSARLLAALVRRGLRIAGTAIAAAGLLAAAWAFTVWQWQDPFTALYTSHQQQNLESTYRRSEAAYVPPVRVEPSVPVPIQRRRIRQAAARYRMQLERGDAVGRLQRPSARPERDRRRGHRQRHAHERPRPLHQVIRPRRGRADLHRWPQDDVRRTARADRPAPRG